MDDRSLLEEFVRRGSQSAFREVVTRHLPVVYSAACRMVGDAHLAQEVAQSVFTKLADKAGSIQPPQVLGGWLYTTTRHEAMHALRAEQRRRVREQVAWDMQSIALTPNSSDITEELEPAMAELDADDRDALVLRYLANRALRDVGTELGISEEAARKRVSRALERLRTVLEHRAVCTSTVLLASVLSSSAVAIPQGLGATISTTALLPTGSVAASGTVAVLKTKVVWAMVAAVLLAGLGTGAFLLQQTAPTPARAQVTNAAPIKLANDAFAPSGGYVESAAAAAQQVGTALLTMGAMLHRDERYFNGLAHDVRRTSNSSPAAHIKSLTQPTTAEYLASLTTRPLLASRFAHHVVNSNSPLWGRRVRISGWLKTRAVMVRAGMSVVIIDAEGHIFACDPMTDRPVRDTMDWHEVEIITDVPAAPCTVFLGPSLYGAGELWADDFQIAVTSTNKAITDDRIWHIWSPNPTDYTMAKDFKNTHDGRASLCFSYAPSEPAPSGSWMWWGQDIRNPDPYKGHTVRMTVWIKTEDIANRLRPNLRPKGPFFQLVAQDKIQGGKPIRGTTDWTHYTITCKIPETTQCLDTGFAFHGSGKFWVDMESLKYEIMD